MNFNSPQLSGTIREYLPNEIFVIFKLRLAAIIIVLNITFQFFFAIFTSFFTFGGLFWHFLLKVAAGNQKYVNTRQGGRTLLGAINACCCCCGWAILLGKNYTLKNRIIYQISIKTELCIVFRNLTSVSRSNLVLVQACLRAPPVVADEAKLAIVSTYFLLPSSALASM